MLYFFPIKCNNNNQMHLKQKAAECLASRRPTRQWTSSTASLAAPHSSARCHNETQSSSNEQLHVVRAVPITNHCVWRKTFLCMPLHFPRYTAPRLCLFISRAGKLHARIWTPLLKGEAAVTHIHICVSWDVPTDRDQINEISSLQMRNMGFIVTYILLVILEPCPILETTRCVKVFLSPRWDNEAHLGWAVLALMFRGTSRAGSPKFLSDRWAFSACHTCHLRPSVAFH